MSAAFDAHCRRHLWMLCGVFLCLFVSSLSPTQAATLPEDAPILISQPDSTRALAVSSLKRKVESDVFPPGNETILTFFVTNLDLLKSEGATAFRGEVETSGRLRHRLEILSLEPVAERPWVYALTVRLPETLGSVGDVLVRVTWRGVSSNRVRLAVGFQGNKIEDDEGAAPTPMPDRPIVRSTTQNIAGLPWTGDRARFMEQATFGPTAAVETRLRRIGYSTWLNEQMEQKFDANGNALYSRYPYPNFPQMPQQPALECNGTSGMNDPYDADQLCFRNHYTMFPLQTWFFREAFYGDDYQLRRRVSWALHQIFVVGGQEVGQSARYLPYIQTLDRNAFGNYRTLLKEITLNPAMGKYLDMAISTKQNPNENYSREILQLFSIGVDLLNQDGTPILDAQGKRIPTFDQGNINEFTKIFTGWTFCNQGCANSQPGIVNYRDPLIPNAANHDAAQKTLLNYPGATPIVTAGQTPEQDLEDAINNIFNHPNVAPFVGKILIQQLVTSNPTPAYVGRVAAIFNNNGAGVRGDMKAVIRAVLLDPEARGNIKTDPDYGKLREPVLLVTNVMRPFNPKANYPAAGCNGQSDGVINILTKELDQDVWNPPSVFNYYQMDYTIPNSGLAGPEFGIFSTGTAIKRANVAGSMFSPRGLSTGISYNPSSFIFINNRPILNPAYAPCGTFLGYFERLESILVADPTGAQFIETLNKEMLRSSMSAGMRSDIQTSVNAYAGAGQWRQVHTALYLVTSSLQFQVQR